MTPVSHLVLVLGAIVCAIGAGTLAFYTHLATTFTAGGFLACLVGILAFGLPAGLKQASGCAADAAKVIVAVVRSAPPAGGAS